MINLWSWRQPTDSWSFNNNEWRRGGHPERGWSVVHNHAHNAHIAAGLGSWQNVRPHLLSTTCTDGRWRLLHRCQSQRLWGLADLCQHHRYLDILTQLNCKIVHIRKMQFLEFTKKWKGDFGFPPSQMHFAPTKFATGGCSGPGQVSRIHFRSGFFFCAW